jgi:hypothetical protein
MAKTPVLTRRAGRAAVKDEAAPVSVVSPSKAPTGPHIVIVEGKKGIFIPLEAADLTKNQPVDELVKTIELLQAVLIEKEREILELNERIAELLTPPQSPDDFSGAIQSAVDSLQTELSHLSNPIANFAVKEFRIDTRVGVRITPLGIVEYRFAGPGERINPESQSLLSLTLVPVAKPTQNDKDLDQFLDRLRPIAQIADLTRRIIGKGITMQQYFESNHVYTIGEFLDMSSRANIRARIVAATQVDAETLLRWGDIAELLLIDDLNYALIIQLQDLGIRGMRGLQKADATTTVTKLKRAEINVEKFRLWQTIAERYLQSR